MSITDMGTIDAVQIHSPGRALLVIDQPVLAELVTFALNHGVFTTRTSRDVRETMEQVGQWHPHLAIVDMDIGQGTLMEELGKAIPRAGRFPIIALTRRGDLKRKLAAFEWGVDDILTVPFSPEELVARALAVMRRTYRTAAVFTPTITLGEIEIDILNRRVHVGDHDLHLTSLEQNLLYLLAANAGRLLTRDQIMDALWGADFVADSNVVDRHIRSLRVKLQNDWHQPRYIATVPGKGYRFVPTVASEDSASRRV